MSDASITGFFISLLRRHPDLRTSGWGHGLIDLAVQYDLEISESVAPPLVVDDVCFVQQPVGSIDVSLSGSNMVITIFPLEDDTPTPNGTVTVGPVTPDGGGSGGAGGGGAQCVSTKDSACIKPN